MTTMQWLPSSLCPPPKSKMSKVRERERTPRKCQTQKKFDCCKPRYWFSFKTKLYVMSNKPPAHNHQKYAFNVVFLRTKTFFHTIIVWEKNEFEVPAIYCKNTISIFFYAYWVLSYTYINCYVMGGTHRYLNVRLAAARGFRFSRAW